MKLSAPALAALTGEILPPEKPRGKGNSARHIRETEEILAQWEATALELGATPEGRVLRAELGTKIWRERKALEEGEPCLALRNEWAWNRVMRGAM